MLINMDCQLHLFSGMLWGGDISHGFCKTSLRLEHYRWQPPPSFLADRYIIRISTNILDLRDKFNDSVQVNTTDLIPKEANSEEVFVFKPEGIPFTNGTDLFIAVQAVDKTNLKSEISNIAQVSLFLPPEAPPETPPETPAPSLPCPEIQVNSTIPGIHILKIMWKWLGELQLSIA